MVMSLQGYNNGAVVMSRGGKGGAQLELYIKTGESVRPSLGGRGGGTLATGNSITLGCNMST